VAEKSAPEIPRPLRELYEKGLTALQRNNLDYAVTLFMDVILKEPAFFDCRERLREAQFRKHGASSGFFKRVMGTANNSPLIAKGQMVLRNNPVEALGVAEQILVSDPNNASAHRLLADAAMACQFPKTALSSLEILFKNSPRDREVGVELANAYADRGEFERGDAIFGELSRGLPGDPHVATAYKNFSARRTLNEGGYDGLSADGSSYRDILKNKDEAVSLEQEQRLVKGDDLVGELIVENEARLKLEPDNLRIRRDLADLWAQKRDFDRA
jgi:tetratricopeptide (TPR) repeat protein